MSLREMALHYAERGFRVLPVHSVRNGVCSCPEVGPNNRPGGSRCPAAGKHPRIGGWEQLATDDLEVVGRWWAQWPDANIGLAMGGDERLVALDIDGEKGRRSLANLESVYGLLPPTLTSKSGRLDGGEHRIFRVPKGFDLKTINKVGFAEGLDTRASGAQIVAPPSIHMSGRHYMWTSTAPIAELPRWLYERIAAGTRRRPEHAVPKSEIDAEAQHFDLTDLRSHLVAYKRRALASDNHIEQDRGWLVEQILGGRAFAVPGTFAGDTPLLRGRDAALNQITSILAWRLPVEVPEDVALELLRPSLQQMDLEPEGFDYWLGEASDMYHRAAARRDEVYATEAAHNKAVVAMLNRRRVEMGMLPISDQQSATVIQLPVRTSGSLEVDQKLTDKILHFKPQAAAQLKVVPDADSGDFLSDTSADEDVEVEDDLAIICAVGEGPRMLEEALRALAKRDENIFRRAGAVVTLAREPAQAEEFEEPAGSKRRARSILLRPGTPKIVKVTAPLLTDRLARVAKWIRQSKQKQKGAPPKWIEMNPDQATVAQILAPGQDLQGIKPLRGIVETPIFTPTFRLVADPGYERETTFVHLPSITFDPIPEAPSQEQAKESLRRLWIELFSDFPYRGLGSPDPADTTRDKQFEKSKTCPDAYVAITLLLTILARPAIRGAVPGGIFEAATPGSGKSLQINVAALVATGRAASFATFPIGRDGKPDEVELEKILSGCALAGINFLAWDNIKGLLGGPALEKVQTAVDSVSLRVLGTSEFVELPWSTVMAFSGNNMTMTTDTSQRNLLSRIESALEDPRSRDRKEFRHPNLLGWIQSNRANLVRDCFVILRAWAVAQNKPDAGTMGSFEEWSSIVPSAILYAGGPNVLEARPRDGATDDADSEAHLTLMRSWPFSEPIKAADVIKHLFDDASWSREVAATHMEARGAIRELLRVADGKNPTANRLGHALRKLRDKVRGGLKFVGATDRLGCVEWRVVRV